MDMNVPESDGKLLYNLVIKNHYTKALEIGTSTGYSALWIAQALSKTGGRLITIEIDSARYRQALANFKAAGLSNYIDARLADAHDLVKELKGPFDFVFCDADKDWYKNYFIAIYPKLAKGGCYTAHNVSEERGVPSWRSGTEDFYDYVKRLPDMATTVDNSGSGMSISYKKAVK
jgi:caffeoyl-CoA O-methyltransferase